MMRGSLPESPTAEPPGHIIAADGFRVGDKRSGILPRDLKALVRSLALCGLNLERVPALGDNHSHVNLRRHIHAYIEPKKNSESFGIA
jgi:hypothetical protein